MAVQDFAEQTVRIAGAVQVANAATGSTTIQTTEALSASLHTAGAVMQPAAGSAICTLTAPPAGFYKVEINRMAGGSGTPSLFNNGEFRVGATIFQLVSVAVLEIPYKFLFYVQLDGSTNLSVNVTSAGAANITICASITATRIR